MAHANWFMTTLSNCVPGTQTALRPMYFVNMVELYERYVVWGYSYNIQIVNASVQQGWHAGVMYGDDLTPETSWIKAKERGQGIWKVGNGYAGSRGMLTFKGYVDVARCNAVQKRQVALDPAYAGTATTGPNKQANLGLYIFSMAPGGVTEECEIVADITYNVTWFDRRDTNAL